MKIYDEIFEAIKMRGEASTYDVAEDLQCSPAVAGKRLREMRRNGVLDSHKNGTLVIFDTKGSIDTMHKNIAPKRMSLDEFLRDGE